MTEFDPRHYTKLMNGNWVQNDLLGIINQIDHEFGDRVKVMYLERSGTGPEALSEEPWIICEWVEQTQTWEKIFGAMEMNQMVLHRLREMDMQGKKAAEVLARLEAKERSMRAEPREKYDEWRRGEAVPLIAAAFKSDKTFTFKNEDGKIVKLHGS